VKKQVTPNIVINKVLTTMICISIFSLYCAKQINAIDYQIKKDTSTFTEQINIGVRLPALMMTLKGFHVPPNHYYKIDYYDRKTETVFTEDPNSFGNRIPLSWFYEIFLENKLCTFFLSYYTYYETKNEDGIISMFVDGKFLNIGLTKKWNLPYGFYFGTGTILFYYDVFWWSRYYVYTNTYMEDRTRDLVNEDGVAVGIPVFIGYKTNWGGGLDIDFELGIGKFLNKTEFLGDYFVKLNLLNISTKLKGEKMDKVFNNIYFVTEYSNTTLSSDAVVRGNVFDFHTDYYSLLSNANITGIGSFISLGGLTELWVMKGLGVETGLTYGNYSISATYFTKILVSERMDFAGIPVILKKHFGSEANNFSLGLGLDNLILLNDIVKMSGYEWREYSSNKICIGQVLPSAVVSMEYNLAILSKYRVGIGINYKKSLGSVDKVPFDDSVGARVSFKILL